MGLSALFASRRNPPFLSLSISLHLHCPSFPFPELQCLFSWPASQFEWRYQMITFDELLLVLKSENCPWERKKGGVHLVVSWNICLYLVGHCARLWTGVGVSETSGDEGGLLNARGNANVWVDNIIHKCSLRTEVFGFKNRGIDEEGEWLVLSEVSHLLFLFSVILLNLAPFFCFSGFFFFFWPL